MADNISFWGLTGVKGTVSVDRTTDTFDSLITLIAAAEGLPTDYYTVSLQRDSSKNSLYFADSSTPLTLDDASIGMTATDVVICALNTSGLTKQERQIQKLEVAQVKRQATFRDTVVYTDPDDAPYFRTANIYDITALPDTYTGNVAEPDDNPNVGGLLPKRPWVTVGVSAAPESISEAVGGEAITDLQVWYDSSDTATITPAATDEDPVQQWADKSAFAHNANPTNGNQKPTYENTVLQKGYGYIEFDGTEAFSINPVAWTQGIAGFTAFIVAKPTSEVNGDTIMTTNTGDFKISHNGSTWTVGMNGVTAVPTSNANTVNNWAVFTFRYNAANPLVFRLNKTAYTLGAHTPPATSSASNTALYLGYDGTNPSFTGFIAEVVMFDLALTATEYANVENYLYNKWIAP